VSPLVINLVSLGSEGPATKLADVGLLPSVGSDMMAQTCSLRKSTVTSGNIANKGLIAKVYVSMSREGGE